MEKKLGTLEDIFNFHFGDSLKSDIQKIDNLCVKLNIDPNDFWMYYRQHTGDFSGTGFIESMLEFFYFWLEIQANKVTKLHGLDIFGWFYFEKGCTKIELSEGEDDFNQLLNLPYESKKELMKNEIFRFLFEEIKIDIFKPNEKRRLKLEKLNDTPKYKI